MKKLLIIILLLFSIQGCKTKSPAVTPVTTGLEFIADISYQSDRYEYNVKINKNGITEIKSTFEPQITYLFTGGKLTISHNDISHETEIQEINNKLPIDLIYSVFNSLSHTKTDPAFKNDNCYIKGNTEKYSYICHFGMSGLPIKITESNYGITVTIKNASILNTNKEVLATQ